MITIKSINKHIIKGELDKIPCTLHSGQDKLFIYRNSIDYITLDIIANWINQNKLIRKLSIFDFIIKSESDLCHFLDAIVDCQLESITFYNCKISGKCLKQILESINASSIKNLELRNSNIEKIGPNIKKLIAFNHNLTKINLINATLTNDDIKFLAIRLKENTNLTSINLDSNDIDDNGAIILAKALRNNNTLKKLDLGFNCIRDIGAIELAKSLMTNESIQYLDLTSNLISDKGTIAIAKMIKNNTSLKKLYLNNIYCKNEGALEIANSLIYNTSITSIELAYNNDITNVITIANILKENYNLTFINLENGNDYDNSELDNIIHSVTYRNILLKEKKRF